MIYSSTSDFSMLIRVISEYCVELVVVREYTPILGLTRRGSFAVVEIERGSQDDSKCLTGILCEKGCSCSYCTLILVLLKQAVIEGCTTLWQNYLICMKCKVYQAVNIVNIEERNAKIDEIFYPDNEFGKPFHGLQSSHRQMMYYKKKFGFLVSISSHTVLFQLLLL